MTELERLCSLVDAEIDPEKRKEAEFISQPPFEDYCHARTDWMHWRQEKAKKLFRSIYTEVLPSVPVEDKKFLFMAVSSSGGSGPFSGLINTSPYVCSFMFEGYYLLKYTWPLVRFPFPELKGCRRTFTEMEAELSDPRSFDWDTVFQIWMDNWQRCAKFSQAKYLMDQTNDSIVWAPLVQKCLGERSYFLLSMRDPYAVCGSMLWRKDEGNQVERRHIKGMTKRCVDHWICCARLQKRNMDVLKNWCFLSYENFCKGKIEGLQKLLGVELSHEIFYPETARTHIPVVGHINKSRISRLSENQVDLISHCLKEHKDLVEFFGYSIREW